MERLYKSKLTIILLQGRKELIEVNFDYLFIPVFDGIRLMTWNTVGIYFFFTIPYCFDTSTTKKNIVYAWYTSHKP